MQRSDCTIAMILLDHGYPTDVRVLKESDALIEAGYRVELFTDQRRPEEALLETMPSGMVVHRVPVPKVSVMHKLYSAWSFDYPEFREALRAFIDGVDPVALHVHDLPFGPFVAPEAETRDLPLIADLHENMPAAFISYRAGKPPLARLANRLYRNYGHWRRAEKAFLARCDRILNVVPEASTRIHDDYGLAEANVIYVSNTEDPDHLSIGFEPLTGTEIDPQEWIVLYIGGTGPHRGLDTSIRSLVVAREQQVPIQLHIVGMSDPTQQAEARALAEREGVADRVTIVGRIPIGQVGTYIRAAHVGLVPHNSFEHTETTVPHKLFQYMALECPVLVSDCAPLKRIVDDTGSGMVFAADTPRDMGDKLVAMYRAGDDGLTQWGAAGRAAVMGPYHWREDAGRLVAMYDELLGIG